MKTTFCFQKKRKERKKTFKRNVPLKNVRNTKYFYKLFRTKL